MMQHQELLENALRLLRLSTFLEQYQTCAQEVARGNLPYERYLLNLCEGELAQREANRTERAIAAARFPVIKELSSYDFSAISNLAKTRVLICEASLAREAQACLPMSAHVSLSMAHTPGSASCWKMRSICSGG
jgi:DNA replication protein DnaC